jgi:hypothetical protein
VAGMKDQIEPLFTQVVMICDKEGLIGWHMFAIDGCNLYLNERSRTPVKSGVIPLKSSPVKKQNKTGRQVQFMNESSANVISYSDKMKVKIDSSAGRWEYSRRLGTIEPVFGNITVNKGMNKFTLRGQEKVTTQWQLYCLVHNIEKLRNSLH